jgi:hypothetical protein
MRHLRQLACVASTDNAECDLLLAAQGTRLRRMPYGFLGWYLGGLRGAASQRPGPLGEHKHTRAPDVDPIASGIFEHREVIYLILLILLVLHFFRQLNVQIVVVVSLLVMISMGAFAAFLYEPIVYLSDVLLFIAVYGVALYVVLCEVLQRGVAKWLTKKRGEKWVKEMDYFYLGFGLLGILGSVNKIDQINGRFSRLDLLAPLVLMTAVVIRFIKTRAEIAGWNKP